jgi:hypothetical protein
MNPYRTSESISEARQPILWRLGYVVLVALAPLAMFLSVWWSFKTQREGLEVGTVFWIFLGIVVPVCVVFDRKESTRDKRSITLVMLWLPVSFVVGVVVFAGVTAYEFGTWCSPLRWLRSFSAWLRYGDRHE